ncbi:isoamylase N-terminal domain protein [Marinomonas sp. MED121]|uniref:isoamylase early set domain-containing protein n=1 Tax=Marinomonas sp. MED121 TaxID=314277 RepID=UPI0000690EE2|nr:isoamylase early set domain-containing protein [Marinomonas sp. MED121]EAQ64304.1 isoamylase N-terminal domain protein [Marinomonas sp. MED121]
MIEKKYLKSKPVCKVKFALSKEQVANAKSIALVGEFNNWDTSATPMRKQKSGVFASTIDLAVDQTYQFRYLLDGNIWINDESADGYVSSQVSHEANCLISV